MNLTEKENYGQPDTDFQDNTNPSKDNDKIPFDNSVTNDVEQNLNRGFSSQQDRDDELDDENDNDLQTNPYEDYDNDLNEDYLSEDEKLQNERDARNDDGFGKSDTEDNDESVENEDESDEDDENPDTEKRQDYVSGDASLTEDIDQDLEEIDPVNHPRQFSKKY
ncbi:hypothetical protein SD960_00210 [Flavobacterium sp. MMLR14_040]|uniref:hypothetical protein n=1 Tax=Flavobacterium sp. MMLR14_040 TaxID=3093843 RepID=UPI00298FEC4F|nr:hypothetical protein [Flavobacterium sp. MMLR14_040]MDW8848493.1 hypothetical protein [Flavobacterium sp. MMLR14_040]